MLIKKAGSSYARVKDMIDIRSSDTHIDWKNTMRQNMRSREYIKEFKVIS
jgi:hypothetical protein